jgi:hypothetical protein
LKNSQPLIYQCDNLEGMRVKVQKYNGKLLGCCIAIPPEMMDALGADLSNDFIELAIEKKSNGLLVKRVDDFKEDLNIPSIIPAIEAMQSVS